jgi:predicted Rossmann fold nucleotide-binding protein DprA/Smf involved in DNA uptake
VLAALPAGADDVVRATGLEAQTVAVVLAELELAGLATEADGLFRGS